MVTDISIASPNKGHFVTVNQWTFDDTEDVLTDIWNSGYTVIASCTDAINQANELIAAEGTTDLAKAQLQTIIMQASGLKAYTYYALVNIFGKDVANNGSTLGVILVKDKKPAPKENVTRATVLEVYNYILELLNQGQEAAKLAGELAAKLEIEKDKIISKSAVYINPTVLSAMEAKVKLSMHDYAGAKAASTLALKSAKDISNEDYLSMWRSNVPSEEDIFTIKKTEDDNLSANALNTLYGSYLATLNGFVLKTVSDTDVRFNLIQLTGLPKDKKAPHPKKYDGLPSAAAVSNIPVIRYSDMYLTLAEAEANLGNQSTAITALLNVAKRNSEVTQTTFAGMDKDALLKFIADERVREFFAEGHRLFDLKRTAASATINGQENYVIANFAFPIPADEINAGYMTQQNDDWKTLLPKKPEKPKK